MTQYNPYTQQTQYNQQSKYGQQPQTQDREYGWDDTIVSDGPEFILLPAGDYEFVVESYERSRTKGTGSLPPCNMAIVALRIDTPNGRSYIKHYLTLHSKCEGMLSAFFTCIGLKKKGQPLQMRWDLVPGCVGKCKVGIRKGNDGNDYNEVKQFYPAPDLGQMPSGTQFTPGAF